MEKNEIVEVSIEDMTKQGEGIGKWNGFPLFIRDAVIGDRAEVRVVKVKKGYGYGRLEQVLVPSPDRTEPRCPVAGPCGGCQLQAMRYEAQLAWKRKKVGNALRRLGGFAVDDGSLPAAGAEVLCSRFSEWRTPGSTAISARCLSEGERTGISPWAFTPPAPIRS